MDRLLQRLILIAVCIIQVPRIFCGLDFTDEMQYYGEIVSLASSNRLFSADLFIQQIIYLLLYPAIKIYTIFWGAENLVLASRILFAAFVLYVFRRLRVALTTAGIAGWLASACAMAATFAIPVHNIYAFSYNSGALGIAAVCLSELFVWRHNGRTPNTVLWVVAVILLGLVYPPVGVAVGIVFVSRLWIEADYRSIGRAAILGSVLAAFAAYILLQFATPKDYLDAIEFSGSFGEGAVIFQARSTTLFLVLLWLVFILGMLLGRRPLATWTKMNGRLMDVLLVTSIVVVCIVSVIIAAGKMPYKLGGPLPAFYAANLMVMSGAFLALFNNTGQSRERWKWISILFLATGCTMSITSGGGLQLTQWAAMLATPFFFALAMSVSGPITSSSSSSYRIATRVFGIGIVAIFATLYLANPFKDRTIWNLTDWADEAPALRHIRINSDKARAINLMRTTLADIAPNSTTMVVGPNPWIYFAINTSPDTDMVYMHTLEIAGKRAAMTLARRLATRRPDYLIVSGLESEEVTSAVSEIIRSGPYACDTRALDPALRNSDATYEQIYFLMFPSLKVCKRLVPR